MGKSLIEKLWLQVDQLKVLVTRNPHIPLDDVRKGVDGIEAIVRAIRRRELRGK